MGRILTALIVGFAAVTVAHAHALYLVPDTGDAARVLVVFSDQLAPDAGVKEATWKRFEGLKLSARDDSGKITPVRFTKEKDHLRATMPAGTRVVFGEVDSGVYGKGDAVPKLVKHYPKAIIGPVPTDGGRLGDATALEIVPQVEAGKVRFQVQARGKPLAGVTVGVLPPGEKEEVPVKTDEQGWTKAFHGAGRYGVTCRAVELTPGERDGKKYDGVTQTATLVMDLK